MTLLVLASQSPRRRELLSQIDVAHEVIHVDVDETPHQGESPQNYVQRITLAKARAGHEQMPDRPILAADTCVVIKNRILGKPEDEEHAVHMLKQLSGTTHQVLTGVALFHAGAEHYQLNHNEVRFCTISTVQARHYWATGEPADKAGGYAVQGRGALFIEYISGSYSGIMGLPLFETGQLLAKAGLLRV
ncbi:MAG TPA: septum formation inhibitor Maf [Thiolapillus brandeum]|uniref:dTTP/UTP pyrophosphatase n=1 Tax=Thiolapillus brandeum TaxID=1076588 RepID=A0A831NSC7_9GAMM|nr:septum formation inhibitor Maf [Thiolapillus brandeum]